MIIIKVLKFSAKIAIFLSDIQIRLKQAESKTLKVISISPTGWKPHKFTLTNYGLCISNYTILPKISTFL